MIDILFVFINAVVPFGIATLLIVLSPNIKKENKALGSYSKMIGLIASVLLAAGIIINLASKLGFYF